MESRVLEKRRPIQQTVAFYQWNASHCVRNICIYLT